MRNTKLKKNRPGGSSQDGPSKPNKNESLPVNQELKSLNRGGEKDIHKNPISKENNEKQDINSTPINLNHQINNLHQEISQLENQTNPNQNLLNSKKRGFG